MAHLKRGRGLAYRPRGMDGHAWSMPDAPAASAPRCITRLNFLPHESNEDSAKAQRVMDCAYLVGEGKGPDEGLPEMMAFTDEIPSDFAAKWLRRDRADDKVTPGYDGEKLPLSQAWCVELMRRRMAIQRGAGTGEREPRHYRLRICPEPSAAKWLAANDEMDNFMRELMRRVCEDHGRQLIWVGAAHYKPRISPAWKTDEEWKRKAKCHAHFAFRGVDTDGRALFFEKKYVDRGFEHRARTLLHEMIGDGKAVRRAG